MDTELDLSNKKDVLAGSLGYDHKDLYNKDVYWFLNKFDNSKSYILIKDDMRVISLIEE